MLKKLLSLLNLSLINKQVNKERLETAWQSTDWVIYYASQRGRAKNLALQTQQALLDAGQTVELQALADIKPDFLQANRRVLFITSTFGNGQAPEAARKFERQLKKSRLNLQQLEYAILALGDKNYDRFCGFGRKLDAWLKQQNAHELQPIITVSQMDKTAISRWVGFIAQLGGKIATFNT